MMKPLASRSTWLMQYITKTRLPITWMLNGTGSPGRAAFPCDGLAAASRSPVAKGLANPCVGTRFHAPSNCRICGVVPKSAAHSVSQVAVLTATPNRDMPSGVPSYTHCAGPLRRTVVPLAVRSVQADNLPESVTKMKRAEPLKVTLTPSTTADCVVTRNRFELIGAPLNATPVVLPTLPLVLKASAPGTPTSASAS